MIYHPEAVLKIGGSLSHESDLVGLCQEISRLGLRQRLLVVPGGGEFADLVREFDRRYKLSDTAAHWMAILAMDQYGYLLGGLMPESFLITGASISDEWISRGGVPILLPARWLQQADPLPHSWSVTSDSIAAWVAGMVGAARLVLLKDVDGLYPALQDFMVQSTRFRVGAEPGGSGELIKEMSVETLKVHRGGVDEYLVTLLSSLDLETWVINGNYPQRLGELFESQQTLGTRIIRASQG